MVTLLKTDVDGWMLAYARVTLASVQHHIDADPAYFPIYPAEAAVLDGTTWFRVIDGVLQKVAPPLPAIEVSRAEGIVMVDTLAENARLRFITNGSGQALEYQATFDEAIAANAAPDPLDPANYPWLASEQTAQQQAGLNPSLRDVINQVMGQRDAWVAAGAAIKEIRRSAKLRIDLANTKGEIDDIINAIVWPTP